MEIDEVKKQLKNAMIGSSEIPDRTRIETLLRQLPSEKLPEIFALVKNCTEYADRQRCRYFTMIKGAKHYQNCRIVSTVLESLTA